MPANELPLLHDDETCLIPSLPFLWPESRILANICSYAENPPWRNVLTGAASFFGIVHGIDGTGVELLTALLKESPNLRFRLVVALYPACPTRNGTLEELRSLFEDFPDRVECRLLLVDRDEERPVNLLCVVQPEDSRPVFLVGPSGNLGLSQPMTSQVNLAFQGDGELLEQCRNWFNYVWCETAIPLRRTTTCIPMLMPAQGDSQAEVLWEGYWQSCQCERKAPNNGEPIIHVEVDGKTGETKVAVGVPASTSLPTDVIGVSRVDDVTRRIAGILGQGSLATIDQGTKIPPLDCPIKPEWFGVDSFTQYGALVRKVEFRISAIDKAALKKLNTFRNKTHDLLTQFSFPWAEGLRWIPNKAKPLLQAEMERINNEGLGLLKGTLGDDVEKYIASRRDRIKRDAETMYRDLHPDENLSDEVVGNILEDLQNRLKKAGGSQLLAKVCYSEVQTGVAVETRWSSPWGQYSMFLAKVVEFSRKCFTNKYFLRGLQLKLDEVLSAMDVGNDHLIKAYFADKRVDRLAEAELALLREVLSLDAKHHLKCTALLQLLEGATADEVKAKLDSSAALK